MNVTKREILSESYQVGYTRNTIYRTKMIEGGRFFEPGCHCVLRHYDPRIKLHLSILFSDFHGGCVRPFSAVFLFLFFLGMIMKNG